MANPKIVYIPVGGVATTLTPAWSPTQQPGYMKTAVRHDNVSSSGIRETVLERVDTFLEATFQVPVADLAAWQAFLDYALTGAPFAFYADSSGSAYTNYLLEDTDAKIEYSAPERYTLKMTWRVLVV
jgi:hypothetical protein